MDGCITYKGFATQQHTNFIRQFDKLISEIRPSNILEIGVAGGGFTLAIKDILNLHKIPFQYRAYEIVPRPWFSLFANHGIDVRIENIFNEDYSDLDKDKVEDVRTFIQSPGKTLVLCDGGNKITEFNRLSYLLKTNDFIMAHDYVQTPEFFEAHIQPSIWSSYEITDADISKAVRDNRLIRRYTDFDYVVWACMEKTK
jgi:cephalosporin hydroxylase